MNTIFRMLPYIRNTCAYRSHAGTSVEMAWISRRAVFIQLNTPKYPPVTFHTYCQAFAFPGASGWKCLPKVFESLIYRQTFILNMSVANTYPPSTYVCSYTCDDRNYTHRLFTCLHKCSIFYSVQSSTVCVCVCFQSVQTGCGRGLDKSEVTRDCRAKRAKQ